MRHICAVKAECTVTGFTLHVFYLVSRLNHSNTIRTWAPFQRNAAVLHVVLEAELGVLLKLTFREKLFKDTFWHNHLAGRARASRNSALRSFSQLANTMIFITIIAKCVSAVINFGP